LGKMLMDKNSGIVHHKQICYYILELRHPRFNWF
jgi:hypothetical protein